MKKYIIIFLIFSLFFVTACSKDQQVTEEKQLRKVEVLEVGSNEGNNTVEAVGIVSPETKVDIVALTQGTVRGVYFDIGNEVAVNKTLVSLYNASLLTNLQTAQTNLINMQNSLNNTMLSTQEVIRQSEIGVQNAEESVRAAQIALDNARDSHDNALELQIKTKKDTQDGAVISYPSYINTVDMILNEVNYILDVDQGIRPYDINKSLLGVKNHQSLVNAENNYIAARRAYQPIAYVVPTVETVVSDYEKLLSVLQLTNTVVNNTITVLHNTVSSNTFPDATIDSLLSSFSLHLSTIVNTINTVEGTLNSLENLDIINESEIEALEHAVAGAQAQLEIAKLTLTQAQAGFESTKAGQDQTVIGSQTALDQARGQVNLAGAQVGDLTIKAPIGGTITAKNVELGAEVSPGQKLGEISKTGLIKVEIDVPAQEIKKFRIGSPAYIEDGLEAMVSSIAPAADPVTKKVHVEIIYNNELQELIQNTTVHVSIPADNAIQGYGVSRFLVPLSAVTIGQTESYVYVFDNGAAKKVLVTLGTIHGVDVEVISGLQQGELLIVKGNKSLTDGEQIELQ